jgi:pyruvate/2-oxoglutarate dehydrogenase complex dihydrolipoamide acyltransferase (E2) component
VDGIARKPAVIDERVQPRDMLDLTVAFDHDVVDGAPAARFVKRLVELIESGYGLEEERQDASAPATG